MLVVQWWRSFACPGSQAEGKRYHDWDGCIERITQLDAWPDVRTGSRAEMLRVSKTGLLLPEKADGGAEVLVCQLGAINRHNRRLFDDLVGAKQDRWGHCKTERFGGLEVQDHLDFCRQLNGQPRRLF